MNWAFPDGVFWWWGAMGECSCEISNTSCFSQWKSGIIGNIIPGCLEQRYSPAGFLWASSKDRKFWFLIWAQLQCHRGCSNQHSLRAGLIFWHPWGPLLLSPCKGEASQPWDLGDDYHCSADSAPDCLLISQINVPEWLVGDWNLLPH